MAETPSSPSSSASPLGHSVIPILNKLQDILAHLDSPTQIDLPQVVVVGSQSSGKSSVLEALVGRDFLPRGSDICTRRPLVLRLLQTKKSSGGDNNTENDEWGVFSHLPHKKFYDFSQIRDEIQAETDKHAGENKGVSDRQIKLTIYSPNVLDITLVDLPGITKVPVGDQPSDIEARIRTMIMNYIKNPSTLILAVTPANSDLANSDALQIAGNADPDGNRTIGIITKLDIMDRGTDAQKLLLGKVIPLRLGYIGVVNRSQEDIMLNRSIKDALVAEEKFFQSRPVYNAIADRCGIPQLAKKLNQILVQHIMAVLPAVKSRISSQLSLVAKEHASYGEITESKAGQGVLLLNILSKYSEAFSSMVDGKNEEMSTSELSGGARIHYIFQSIFVKSLEEVDPCEDLTDDEIRTAIQNATGPRSALFVPHVPFEVLVRRQIARLLDPSLQCARFIYAELSKISRYCVVSELQRFPVMRRRVDEVVGNFLQRNLEPVETMIGHIIEMEMDYINTSHSSFIGGSIALERAILQVKSARLPASVPRLKDKEEAVESDRTSAQKFTMARPVNGIASELGVRSVTDVEKGKRNGAVWGISSMFKNSVATSKVAQFSKTSNESIQSIEHDFNMIHLSEPPISLRPTETRSEQESIEIAVTKILLRSYYDIVRKNIEDAVPKAIMHFLVNHTKRELHNVFIRKLYRENIFEEMLQEPIEVAKRRKLARENLCILQQALQTLEELPLEANTVDKGYGLGADTTGLPRSRGLPTSSVYTSSFTN